MPAKAKHYAERHSNPDVFVLVVLAQDTDALTAAVIDLLPLPCQSRMLRCTPMAWSAGRIVAKDLTDDFVLVHIIRWSH